jgi:hypothetical protein
MIVSDHQDLPSEAQAQKQCIMQRGDETSCPLPKEPWDLPCGLSHGYMDAEDSTYAGLAIFPPEQTTTPLKYRQSGICTKPLHTLPVISRPGTHLRQRAPQATVPEGCRRPRHASLARQPASLARMWKCRYLPPMVTASAHEAPA